MMCQTRYNALKNENEVVVSIRNQSLLNSKLLVSVVPILALTALTACGIGQPFKEPPSSTQPSLPTGTIPPKLPPPPVPAVIPGLQQGTDSGATVTPVEAQQPIRVGKILGGVPITRDSIRDPSHPLAKRIVFFGYNSSRLTPDSLDLVRGHAEYLSRFSDVRVRIEGHTDERGSREYNIALGDNRARAVAKILQLQGVDAGQFSTLSYGEEVPLDEGEGERAWRRNRRVEVVYEGYN